MEQQSGQDQRAFLESIKAAAGEADIQGMTQKVEHRKCFVPCLLNGAERPSASQEAN